MSSTLQCKGDPTFLHRDSVGTIIANLYSGLECRKNRALTLMSDLGKLLIVAGIVLLVAGIALTLLARTNLPLGRLPGDMVYRGKNSTFYFPFATSLLVSVLLSIVLYFVGRWRR